MTANSDKKKKMKNFYHLRLVCKKWTNFYAHSFEEISIIEAKEMKGYYNYLLLFSIIIIAIYLIFTLCHLSLRLCYISSVRSLIISTPVRIDLKLFEKLFLNLETLRIQSNRVDFSDMCEFSFSLYFFLLISFNLFYDLFLSVIFSFFINYLADKHNVSRLTNLKRLEISSIKAEGYFEAFQCMIDLRNITKLTSLEELTLQYYKYLDFDMNYLELSFLKSFPHLKKLSLLEDVDEYTFFPIRDIDFLDGLEELKEVTLPYNSLNLAKMKYCMIQAKYPHVCFRWAFTHAGFLGIFDGSCPACYIGDFTHQFSASYGDYCNLFHGKGTIEFEDGSRYEGNFKEGKVTGNGALILSNGEKYEGNWFKHLSIFQYKRRKR